jgi:hypothetical protein
MADFKTIVPELKVADMQRAVGFYTSVLAAAAGDRRPRSR